MDINTFDEDINTILEPGKFTYVLNDINKKMLVNAWYAITQLGLWDYMKKDTVNYIFSGDKEIYMISDKMFELGYRDHSGYSFSWIMRQMQYIAQHGEENYKQNYLR
jgi:hypothetical protein